MPYAAELAPARPLAPSPPHPSDVDDLPLAGEPDPAAGRPEEDRQPPGARPLGRVGDLDVHVRLGAVAGVAAGTHRISDPDPVAGLDGDAAAPQVRELNTRAYDRYRRYGFAHDTENFKMDMTNDVLIYTALKGSRASAQAGDFLPRQPKITIWTGSTEAPDETAHGDWMKLVATAGLQWDTAILDYLVLKAEERARRRAEKETSRKTAVKKLRLPGKLADCSGASREGGLPCSLRSPAASFG